jgi:hypothetical protein
MPAGPEAQDEHHGDAERVRGRPTKVTVGGEEEGNGVKHSVGSAFAMRSCSSDEGAAPGEKSRSRSGIVRIPDSELVRRSHEFGVDLWFGAAGFSSRHDRERRAV